MGVRTLAAIRKEEALRAGKMLGIRHHYFLDQRDLGFDTDAASAESGNWDRARIRSFLSGLLANERYDAIFTLLPTAETHGHHRAATVLALETVAHLPDGHRPLIFGAIHGPRPTLRSLSQSSPAQPLTRTVDPAPVITFHRDSSFGYRNALNYQIVVNWVIAEHKSQGLFQKRLRRREGLSSSGSSRPAARNRSRGFRTCERSWEHRRHWRRHAKCPPYKLASG